MSDTFLVECYWSGVDPDEAAAVVSRLGDAEGPVRWLGSILIPEDEIVLATVEARSADDVRASAQAAGLPAERVVACVRLG
jgi:hypothetical protein